MDRGRVLVVDDDAAQRRLMQLRLEEEHFTVLAVGSGEDCLAKAGDFEPDVILLDINMPGLDGIETCRRLKQLPDLGHVPVVFVTGARDDDPTIVEALRVGGNDFMSKDASATVMLARLSCQITICRTQRQLRKIAMTDELTGVFSRRFLWDSLRRAVKSATRTKPGAVACLMADLDHFKGINDSQGHMIGDMALRATAELIRKNTRETDIVGRYGGEEFVIILPDTDVAGAVRTAEKIRAAVEAGSLTTLSIGVAVLVPPELDLLRSPDALDEAMAALLANADAAMYVAKRGGRNRVTVYDPEMSAQRGGIA